MTPQSRDPALAFYFVLTMTAMIADNSRQAPTRAAISGSLSAIIGARLPNGCPLPLDLPTDVCLNAMIFHLATLIVFILL